MSGFERSRKFSGFPIVITRLKIGRRVPKSSSISETSKSHGSINSHAFSLSSSSPSLLKILQAALKPFADREEKHFIASATVDGSFSIV
jgi:hypothetical protein